MSSFEEDYRDEPVLSADTAYVRTGALVGRVYAVALDTGELLWSTDRNVVSNVAVTEGMVFFLTEEGELVGVSPASGQRVATAGFSPSNLPLNTSDSPVGAYLVAASEGRVFALLGDSDQLFAFSVPDRASPAQ